MLYVLITIIELLSWQERVHKTRIQKLKVAHAEEVASLNLDIFELRDQMKHQSNGEQNICWSI